jgi:outer membrane protein assembly factor BamD
MTLATTAMEYFDQVISSYPSSEFVEKSKEYKDKCQHMLADKAKYIADFYFTREKWESALGRYEDMMKNFPMPNYDVEALYGATISAYKMKDMDRAKNYFKRLLAEYPSSKELEKARKELADGF